MPPHPHWWHGRDDVIGFVARTGLPDLRKLRAEANGQPAVAWYVRETPGGPDVASSIEVLCFDGERVSAIVAFVSKRLFALLRAAFRTELARRLHRKSAQIIERSRSGQSSARALTRGGRTTARVGRRAVRPG